jgi:hypothetical protein
MKGMLLRVILLAMLAQVGLSQNEIMLLASSPFRMILGPTATVLNLVALTKLKEGIATALIGMQEQKMFLDMEVVVQQTDLVELDEQAHQSALPATSIRFFVLATILAQNSVITTSDKHQLDSLITKTFSNSLLFILKITEVPELQGITRVAVVAVAPASPVSGFTKRKLSSLDIVLIVLSVCIFLGIIYMVFQHHRDQGWLENQRIMSANETSHVTDQLSPNQEAPLSHVKEEDYHDEVRDHDEDLPTTASAENTAENGEETRAAPRTPTRCPPRLTNVPLPPVPLLPPSPHDVASHLLSDFEINRFHDSHCRSHGSKKDSQSMMSGNSEDGDDEASDSKDGLIGAVSSNESSEDVFQINIEALGDEATEEDKRKKYSAAISDWFRSIRVVSSAKSSLEQSSKVSTASMPESSPSSSSSYSSASYQTSYEQLSLGHIMSDSSLSETNILEKEEV